MMMGGGGNNHRYNLTFSVFARNITNRINLATPNGLLNVPDLATCSSDPSTCDNLSPYFGKSNSLARQFFSSSGAPRTFYLHVSFSF